MRTAFCGLVLVLVGTASAPADAPGTTGSEFFEKKIRPVLVQHCYECHSVKTKKHKGGLLLDSRSGLRQGGDSGPALVPGKPEESLILKVVRQQVGVPKMPPKGKLPETVIADLETWIRAGAPDPRTTAGGSAVTASWADILQERRRWWSLQPVRKPAVPPVQHAGSSHHPVDRFLLTQLEQAGLQPVGSADRRTLIRRLSLVLTGLPPTPEDVEAALSDKADDWYEKQVDRLLASPHFGERWARHWLDVVRFAETHGNEWNYEVHHAWRYRDYLIRAFNDDVPYDQFVREHIAGDLLPQPRWHRQERSNESVIGTAFYRFGEVNHDDCITLRQIGYDLVDNQIDTLSKAFQATTVACARCHDHKLDAVSTKDYYALLGTLRSSRSVSHTIDAPEVNAEPIRRLAEIKDALRRELAEVWRQDARATGRYLGAAQARLSKRTEADDLAKGLDPQRLQAWERVLKAGKTPVEDLLHPWLSLAAGYPAHFGSSWRGLAERWTKEENERNTFNRERFQTWADFRSGQLAGWQAGGQGLRQGPTRNGDWVINTTGDALVKAILPAGCFTHTLSDRLNGTLRSPLLPADKKYISFQVMGRRSSALRLVSNNCQLNYTNYRALTWDEPRWITFPLPKDAASLRSYAELMTMFDNPKFPDQLSGLGGDGENYKVPWEQAAANPHSFFGVTQVVLHDSPEPPKPELSQLRPLLTGPEPANLTDLAQRYADALEAAVGAWATGQATADDVRWLNSFLQRGLLTNNPRVTSRLETLSAQYRAVEQSLTLPRVVPGLADFGPGLEQPLFIRGDCLRPGEAVPRRYLEVLSEPRRQFTAIGSGRLELAEQIASPANPLTARVMVNRIWHHLFGSGIVRTTDDFGHVGDRPSHPELLDYLAAQFVDEGWSVKRLIRSLVLTRTFQMSNRPEPAAREADPLNRLLHHYPARRVEAEAIRDALLAASGRLDRTLYGMSIQPYRDKPNADRRLFPGPLDGNGRRSVYIKNNLMEGPKFLSVFNFPGGKVAQGRRDLTQVPSQALALLNDPFVLQQAALWGERLTARSDATVSVRIDHLFLTALGRPPEPAERQRFVEAVALFADLHSVPTADVLRSPIVWRDVAHTMFNLQEFIFIP